MKNTAILKRPWPALAVLGALALGGCSGANVGSSWQCPLAQGGTCDSVAGADPAVPQTVSFPRAASAPGAVSDPGSARQPVLREPLYRAREKTQTEPPCRAGCDGGFDPFGWLARLFGADRKDEAPPRPAPAPESAPAPAAAGPGGDPDVEAPAETATGTATLPGEPQPAPDDRGDDLRTEEVVARIWIAPFVDGGGVYREASHVRVVLEPAGWRVP